MSFNEVMAELPALSVAERQLLVRRALELDDSPLSPADETKIEARRMAHRQDPGSAIALADKLPKRVRFKQL